ncbi:MAG: hypothetical protein IPQ07_44685 [Myxococcales bacterium]|nr:hypothetical protein [Myxococcales bacterium]
MEREPPVPRGARRSPLRAGSRSRTPRSRPAGAARGRERHRRDPRRGAYWWWYGPWYEHQNLRDGRAGAFTQGLAEVCTRYAYVTRATTPGTFVVPPPKTEEMYMPGRSGAGRATKVIVE